MMRLYLPHVFYVVVFQETAVPKYKSPDEKLVTLNFGPQHPAAHGVLRLILQCKGEVSSLKINLLYYWMVVTSHSELYFPYQKC